MKLKQKVIPLLLSIVSSSVMAASASPNILWHNSTTGAIKFMPVNGMTPGSTLTVVDSSNTNLLPKGMGDFTGDGKPDILFHNQNSGNLRIWEMDGATKVENIQVLGSSNTNLKIAGVGDFDGDGDTDIATFNTNSGSLRMWVMEGTERIDNVLVLSGANTNLVPRGAGDMDGDGIPDIVLRNNNSGAVRVWTMNADFSRRGNEYVTGSSNTNLELRGVTDINGDGNNDILNYNIATGKLRAWLMDGNLKITENAEVTQEADLDLSARGGVVATIYEGKVWNVSNVSEFRTALEEAVHNGESDTIVLDKGVYSTTSDGLGTFGFMDDEEFDLTITSAEGLTHKDVILDGNNTDQVISFINSNWDTTLELNGISVINGYSATDGGGAYSNQNIKVVDCDISYNETANYKSGGGFYAEENVFINNTNISYNKAYSFGGGFRGGFRGRARLIAKNSIVSYNTVIKYSGGGFISGDTILQNMTVTHNTAYAAGGGFSGGNVKIVDSNISNNTAGDGGGFYASGVNVSNTIISNNTLYGNEYDGCVGAGFFSGGGMIVNRSYFSNNRSKCSDSQGVSRGGGLYYNNNTHGSSAIICNSVFVNNNTSKSSAIYITGASYSYLVNNSFIGNSNNLTQRYDGAINIAGNGAVIINNIFDNNTTQELYFNDDAKVYNNYIDYTKVGVDPNRVVVKKNNLQPASAGSIDLEGDNITLMPTSPAIDAGLNPDEDSFQKIIDDYNFSNNSIYDQITALLSTDILGQNRINNSLIDIGASEYNLSK